jgi:hypothetical protein
MKSLTGKTSSITGAGSATASDQNQFPPVQSKPCSRRPTNKRRTRPRVTRSGPCRAHRPLKPARGTPPWQGFFYRSCSSLFRNQVQFLLMINLVSERQDP